MALLDKDLRYIRVNDTLAEMNGFPTAKHLGRLILEILPRRAPALEPILQRVLATGEPVLNVEVTGETMGQPGIQRHWIESFFPVASEDGQQSSVGVIVVEITARKKAQERYQRLMKLMPIPLCYVNKKGEFIYLNDRFIQAFGYTHDDVPTLKEWFELAYPDEAYRNLVVKTWESSVRTAAKANIDIAPIEYNVTCKDGTVRVVLISGITIEDNLLSTFIDVTERRRAEEDWRKLQAQLLQSQKMESVGRLAGGVAHDFNNMLGVILGHTELALTMVDPAHPLHADLDEIYKATMRSADITRQLLAFARKQTITPAVLDLNQTLENILKMLRRLIGEDIGLAWLPGRSLYPVKMDPVQVGQILANLCVNARDAITDVGKITIETGNVVFDETYCTQHPGFAEGAYALLTVSDDGCGMEKEILNQIFEPYFTSKELGKGTGLGLSTVYGIVKQNNGFINVYSEPGKGTTFRIYLPCYEGQAADTEEKIVAIIPPGHGETVLVVEDEPALLTLAEMMLGVLGYRVLVACTPNEAIGLAQEHAGEIKLLITDVVMPEMNGRDMAECMQSFYPGLNVLFMSGYTADVIVHRGVLNEGVNFIQKPFSMKDLAVKVREVLDSE
jgi:PAS domain S-box-containing protein